MLNKIINWSLLNRVAVLILSAVILIAGCFTLINTEVDIFPDLNAPTVTVMTECPGMAPEEVEKIVTFPIETAMNGATGVRRVRSASSTGFSAVNVEFDWGTDIYRDRQTVSERLALVAEQLPAGVGTPQMGPQSSILGEMMIIGLTSPDSTVSMLHLRSIADRVVRPRLLAIGGVSQVSVQGGDAREFQIRYVPGRMKSYGVSLSELTDAVEQFNDNATGGILYDYGNEYIIKGEINTADTQELARAVIKTDDAGRVVRVGDVADVVVAGAQPRIGVASVEGVPAVLVTVTKQPAVGTVELTARIDAELADLAPGLPAGVNISSHIFRQSEFIATSISNLQEALLEGAFFVIVVLFFFLMDLRTTVISVVALPLSIIITVLVLHYMGYTINTMSLGGIAIAIGSLVDDAIVDVENVYHRLRQNFALPPADRRPVTDVVFHASAEVRMPIFNSTLIIIASFLPLFFLTGMEGRLLIPLGVSFIVALIASTIVALTLTPVLCTYLLGGKSALSKSAGRDPWITRKMRAGYEWLLALTLRYRRGVLVGTALLFIVAVALFFTLGRSFLPPFNEGSFTVNVATMPGVSLDESDRIGRMAEEMIMQVPEVITVGRKTGRAELAEHSFGSNVSELDVPYKLNGRTRNQVARDIRERLAVLPGVNIELGQPISHRIDAMLSGTEAQIAIKLFGDDLTRLYSLGQQIKSSISSIPGVVDVNLEQQVQRPEVVISPRREALSRYGVTIGDFNRAISTAIAGVKVSQVYQDGLPYDITLVADPSARASLDALKTLTVDTPVAGAVPLTEVADIRSTTGPNTINRENVKRRLIISANVDGRDLRGVVDDIRAEIAADVTLPEGYYLTYGGQFESEAKASRTLLIASLGALLIILMLLFAQFRNFTQSLLILLNIPLGLIGGVLILVFTGAELNIPAIIGFISLLGITTRNGMLLISRYNTLEAEGIGLAERIRIGSSDRLLPIVMTALTSALALIPLAVNYDSTGNEIQAPMATVILGGLITSTILNVFVVPAAYYIINLRKKK
ncbi:MAG: CusA/CzcA family heavy metal efflux RND transporter [Muribaculaceae bacterium]|nr:CusA/CzcA family heavy metal efflux RND transporter [Muribaculaceae bacterium]